VLRKAHLQSQWRLLMMISRVGLIGLRVSLITLPIHLSYQFLTLTSSDVCTAPHFFFLNQPYFRIFTMSKIEKRKKKYFIYEYLFSATGTHAIDLDCKANKHVPTLLLSNSDQKRESALEHNLGFIQKRLLPGEGMCRTLAANSAALPQDPLITKEFRRSLHVFVS